MNTLELSTLRMMMTKKDLSGALAGLEKIIPARSSNPVLTSLKLTTREKDVVLEGTNLEVDLQVIVPADVSVAGQSLVVPAHLFAQLVRNAGGDLLTMELVSQQLVLSSGGGRFEVTVGDASVYPALSFAEKPVTFRASASGLAEALGEVLHASSQEAFQAVFRGVKVEIREGLVRAVASDGYRVAISEVSGEGMVLGVTGNADLIVPARSVKEIKRMLEQEPAGTLVSVTAENGALRVGGSRAVMNAKLLDGDFPDYERVIPKQIVKEVRLSAASLAAAVNNVAVLADKNANNRVELTVSNDRITLVASGDYGSGRDTVDATVVGEASLSELQCSFNARHLLDASGEMDGDLVFQFSGSLTPAVLKEADGDFRAVVVTLRT